MPDFLPRREGELLEWSVNFRAQVSASPGAYGLTAQDAAEFSGVQQAFAEAYRAAVDPSTRTVPRVAAKNTARDAMMRMARELAGVVRARRATTDEQLVVLGLRPRRETRRAVPRPPIAPIVRVQTGMGRVLRIRVMEAETGRCRKPKDVALVALDYAVGVKPPAVGASGWHRLGTTGRTRLAIEAPAGARPGERLWVTACWLNERGEAGPWATPAWGYVNYGVASPNGAALRAA